MTTSSASAPLFSVVICTYKRYDLLSRAVASVLAQDIGDDNYDLWIIDNSPPSIERELNRLRYMTTPRLHYVDVDTPGLANARNVAIEKSQAKYIVFLDDDAEAVPSWLRSYHAAFQQLDERTGVINGRILPDFETPRPVWLHDCLLGYLSVIDWFPSLTELPNEHSPVGANVAFRRDALIECGCFPVALGRRGAEEVNLMSGEESGLVDALRTKGWKLFYSPDAQVTHHIPAHRLTREWFRRRASWQAISDQINAPLKAVDAPQLWGPIIGYLQQVPRDQAPFMGIYWDVDDPELFRQQLTFLQFLTQISISQGRYPPELFGERPQSEA